MISRSIVNSIRKDGISQIFMEATDEVKKDIMFAYLDCEIKKFQKFQTKFQTNIDARNAFIEHVFWTI